MKNRRLFLALMVALAVSLVATSFLYKRVKGQFAKSATTGIVASSKALEAGTQLTAEMLGPVEWPASLRPPGAFDKPEQAVGRILLYPIPAKEPIREEMLANPGSAMGLTAKIPDGMRAVAVMTNELNNVSGFLFPGSHVDVLVTFKSDNGMRQEDAVTTTVLQNVEVLSTGERLEPDPSGKPQNVKVVTVLLNPDDAEKLMLASNLGTVQFVIRNGADQEQEKRQSVDLGQLKGAPVVPPAVKRTQTVAKAPVYEVEAIDGTKKSVVKF